MWRWWLALIIVAMALLTQVAPLRAAGLRNLAVLELLTPWLAQRAELFDPPCHASGAFPGAKRYLELASAQEPANVRTLTHLGRVWWLEGDCDEALMQWKSAAVSGDLTAAYELFRVGRYSDLSQEIRQQLADMAYQYALKFAPAAKDQLAHQWVSRAIALIPQRKKALVIESWYGRSGDIAAIRALWQAMANAHSANDPEHWFAIAKTHEQDGRWELAAKAYIQGAGLSTDPLDFWMQAGRAWEQISEWDQAIQAYEQAAAIKPPSMSVYLALGNVYRIRGQYSEAIRFLRIAQEVEPDNFLPYHYLGLVFSASGDQAQARLNFEKALGFSPDDPWVMYQLARLWYYGMSQPATGEYWLMRAISQLEQPPANWWIELGDWRLAQKRCEDARQAYSAARNAGVNSDTLEAKLTQYASLCGPN